MTFRPEFLNRVDEIIIFQPLTAADISQIVKLQIDQVSNRLNKQGIKIKLTPAAINHLAQAGMTRSSAPVP